MPIQVCIAFRTRVWRHGMLLRLPRFGSCHELSQLVITASDHCQFLVYRPGSRYSSPACRPRARSCLWLLAWDFTCLRIQMLLCCNWYDGNKWWMRKGLKGNSLLQVKIRMWLPAECKPLQAHCRSRDISGYVNLSVSAKLMMSFVVIFIDWNTYSKQTRNEISHLLHEFSCDSICFVLYVLKGRGIEFDPHWEQGFSRFNFLQTGPKVLPASYPMGTGVK
jgi:hypothetical protein